MIIEVRRARFRWHVIEVTAHEGERGGRFEWHVRRGAFWRWSSAMRYAEYLAKNDRWEREMARGAVDLGLDGVDLTPDPGLTQRIDTT